MAGASVCEGEECGVPWWDLVGDERDEFEFWREARDIENGAESFVIGDWHVLNSMIISCGY